MIIDVKPLYEDIKVNLLKRIEKLKRTPKLVAVTFKPDPSTVSYLKSQEKAAKRFGLDYEIFEGNSPKGVLKILAELSRDNNVNGIFVTHPLSQVNEMEIFENLVPSKDIEGRHPYNLGMLAYGEEFFAPCTAEAVVRIMENEIGIPGKNVVIVGRSNTVGKPLAIMLLRRDRSATVTVCHTKTRNLSSITKGADVVVAAAGRPGLITVDMVEKDSIIIDVGINVTDEGIIGDVSKDVANFAKVTPVPGGVGKITTILLMEHLVKSAEKMNF
ncbi:methenyltetrahydrofolate cyclohydrolase [Thermosipho melanesiensis]|uniref:Bifunctional protein FolD n=2 Tax=Thermosipho melanesiensis TaxID=46541 RepID=FOLD_THEM4|nr:bifunctional 5,10-methylenetetrahydrofolate dehydrogenase/5,10-methenyltetrahydrofolate cyclohydrolase [Thermosipho melanesiensis]A6LP88.1 RecName: Full=Bifunctional protein FolD; Includes: RecName: Full=Methylenetetrahydrofolate dehydrogenase; Includes: RecName: Full=Methenyltetrahydrofolate cyclohydrolase [Thermosipho melanesiensis BI429]ABR31739.1 tetrahydrofolate dehydrogenase/cyclohydrolase [Thermosipho melanesiensis BI429]APT74761.1 methenyltetrahydrofolate cyclohydrolase [Thermosipho m